MSRKRKLKENRPKHICSRGPWRKKRDHLEDLPRWDVRDYIDEAVPDLEADDCWEIADETECYGDDEDYVNPDLLPVGVTIAADPRDPSYTIFQVDVELQPGHRRTLRLYRGDRFPKNPNRQRSYFWYWICPSCEGYCRYLYTFPRSAIAMCRKCWKLPYLSQSKSQARRNRENLEKQRKLNTDFHTDGYGGWFELRGGYRRIYFSRPKPPSGWVPEDLMRKYVLEKEDLGKLKQKGKVKL